MSENYQYMYLYVSAYVKKMTDKNDNKSVHNLKERINIKKKTFLIVYIPLINVFN